MLLQVQHRQFVILECASRKLLHAERNYHAQEREALAIKFTGISIALVVVLSFLPIVVLWSF